MVPFFYLWIMRKLIGLFIITFSIVITSCKKKDEPRTSIFGAWNCEHYSEISYPVKYQATITHSTFDTSLYVVSNFHNFGINEENQVYFTIDENGDLILESNYLVNQTITVSGKGVVADDYSQINWTYTVNSTTIENVEAVYR